MPHFLRAVFDDFTLCKKQRVRQGTDFLHLDPIRPFLVQTSQNGSENCRVQFPIRLSAEMVVLFFQKRDYSAGELGIIHDAGGQVYGELTSLICEVLSSII
jgi:hypothetical protein